MPIEGLSDGTRISFGGGFTEIGKIRKGAPQQGGKVGPDLDYFRVEFNPGFSYLKEAFDSIYTATPRTLNNVMMTADTIEATFDSWKTEWGGQRILKRKCDGKTIVSWYDFQNNCQSDKPRPCESKNGGCKCSNNARLFIMLPDFFPHSGIGYFTLSTGAIRDITNIHGTLQGAANMGIPLLSVRWTLSRSLKEVPESYEKKDGTRGRTLKKRALIFLTLSQESSQAFIAAATGQHALPAPNDTLTLPTGEIINADDAPHDGDFMDLLSKRLSVHYGYDVEKVQIRLLEHVANDVITHGMSVNESFDVISSVWDAKLVQLDPKAPPPHPAP